MHVHACKHISLSIYSRQRWKYFLCPDVEVISVPISTGHGYLVKRRVQCSLWWYTWTLTLREGPLPSSLKKVHERFPFARYLTHPSLPSGGVVCSVSPRAGTALIFNHDTLHEGQPVTDGTKYIIRTEIMYRRVDTEMLPNPKAYRKNKDYIKTVALYTKSWELEQG